MGIGRFGNAGSTGTLTYCLVMTHDITATERTPAGSAIRLSALRCLFYEVALNGWQILRKTVNDFSLWRIIEYPWATRALDLQRGDLVLDIGSGTSSYPHMLAKEGLDLIVLELELERVRWQRAKREATARPGDGRFFPLVASATDMPIRSESMRRIAAVSSLEHIPDDAAVGKEIGRIMASGSVAAITLPYTSTERKEFFAGIRRFQRVERNTFVQEGKAGSFFRFYTDEDIEQIYIRPARARIGEWRAFGRSLAQRTLPRNQTDPLLAQLRAERSVAGLAGASTGGTLRPE
jgi:SAM-dependent methyltransferase